MTIRIPSQDDCNIAGFCLGGGIGPSPNNEVTDPIHLLQGERADFAWQANQFLGGIGPPRCCEEVHPAPRGAYAAVICAELTRDPCLVWNGDYEWKRACKEVPFTIADHDTEAPSVVFTIDDFPAAACPNDPPLTGRWALWTYVDDWREGDMTQLELSQEGTRISAVFCDADWVCDGPELTGTFQYTVLRLSGQIGDGGNAPLYASYVFGASTKDFLWGDLTVYTDPDRTQQVLSKLVDIRRIQEP